MSDTETILAFAGIMLVFALAAIGLDWFGKPVKGRRFIPKIYRYPHERRIRGTGTPWLTDRQLADQAAREAAERAAREAEKAARRAAAPPKPKLRDTVKETVRAANDRAAVLHDGAPTGAIGTDEAPEAPPSSHRDFIAARSLARKHARATAEHRALDTAAVRLGGGSGRDRGRGWQVGLDVFNFTEEGTEPDSTEVERRYWLNVAAADTTRMFGEGNHQRMADGKPPKRRNRRTGRVESMQLEGTDFQSTGGLTPVPNWPTSDVDPFDL